MTEKQKAFCDYYIETGKAAEAYRKAYPSCKKDGTARANGSRLLTNANVSQYIDARLKQMESDRIATPEEILKYFTSVMRGEVKDQFDLDAPLSERTKAADALAKRFKIYEKDNKELMELEIEYKKLQNAKLKEEIAKIKGEDVKEFANDGFIEALSGKTAEVWNEE